MTRFLSQCNYIFLQYHYYYFIIIILKILPLKSMNLENSFVQLDSALEGLGPQLVKMRQSIYEILASILHLGNVKFSTNNDGFAEIMDNSKHSIQHAAELLKISSNDLERVLLQQTTKVSKNLESYTYE